MTAVAGPVSGDAPVADLVARARGGDQRAWDAIVERYAPLVWSICRRYRLDGADTDDAGQAVWLQLVDHLDTIRDPAALPRLAGHHHPPRMRPDRARSAPGPAARLRAGHRLHPRRTRCDG
jgi:hypothetical protein